MDSEDRMSPDCKPLNRKLEENPREKSDRLLKNEIITKRSLCRLYINLFISSVFMSGEITGGLMSGSIAVITDAFHIFTDILGFLIIILSLQLTRKQATMKMTYGYHRAEVLGTLLSVILIWGITGLLVYEAIGRLIKPQEVNGLIMLVTACCGLFGNIFMGLILILTDPTGSRLKQNEDNSLDRNEITELDAGNNLVINQPVKKRRMSLNIKAAFIHVLGDGIQSIGVCISGTIVFFKPEYRQADPACTLLFCVVVISTTLPLLADCVKILMEASPTEIEMHDMIMDLKQIDDVVDVHDVHVWNLSSGKPSVSCHLVSDNPRRVLSKATQILKDKFNIGHVTIQIETVDVTDDFRCENDLH